MYSKTKRVFSIILAVLCLCFCVLPSAAPRAEAAFPLAIAAGVGAVAVTIFGFLGITFQSMNDASKAANGFYNYSSDVKADLDALWDKATLIDGRMKIPFSAFTIPIVLRLVQAAKDYFNAENEKISIPTEFSTTAEDVIFTSKTQFSSTQELFNSCSYNGLLYANTDLKAVISSAAVGNFDVNVNGVSYSYYFEYQENGIYTNIGLRTQRTTGYITSGSFIGNPDVIDTKRSWALIPTNYISDLSNIKGVRFGFSLQSYENNNYLVPFIGVCYIDNSGFVKYSGGFPPLNANTSSDCIPVTEVYAPITNDVEFGKSNISIDKLISAIEEIQNTLDETQQKIIDLTDVYNGYTDTAEGAAEDEEEQTVPYVPSLEWLKEKLRDLGLTADVIDKITAGTTDTDTPIDTPTEADPDIPELPDLRDKFPFCVPFDLIALVGALNAPAEVPVFTVPIKMDFVNYEDEIVIDFSGFEKAAAVIRWGTTIFFILGLIVVSRKMIQA